MNEKDLAIALGIGGLVGVCILLAKKIQSQQSTTSTSSSTSTSSTPQVEITNVSVQ